MTDRRDDRWQTDRRQTDGRQHIANVNRLDKFWSDQELSVIIDYDAELHGVGNRSIILQYYVYAYYIRYFRVISRIQKPLRLYFRFHVRYMLSPVRLSSVCLSVICHLKRSCTLLRWLRFSALFLWHLVYWPSVDINRKFYGDRLGNISVGRFKPKRGRGSKI